MKIAERQAQQSFQMSMREVRGDAICADWLEPMMSGESQPYVVGFAGADQGWGRRASWKAKTVMRMARTAIELSSRIFLRLTRSGVAKHPQLMSMWRRKARVTALKNPSSSRVTSVAQICRRQPIK